ncbi:hypothetical protein HHK36_023399 [Tetracentron sinense]|uniref:Protein phosphatase n=1 Tax=Tetracentron sinense TaxID=13715 RepID=A0A835D8N3_TETSI|nr:hypothetical protein HHK36_023399 [Tetracentron sinense]
MSLFISRIDFFCCLFKCRNVSSKRNLKLISGSCYLPKNSEWKPEGEDAHFICEEDRVIGVSDGVGGYSLRGIDSGIYARELMSNSVIAVQHEPKGSVDPATVLTEAYSNTKSEGAATACIVALTGQQYLHAANIGDSGFVVFREGHIIYCSPTQQHSFNCPYQLGNDRGSDRPVSAQIIKVPVKPGDIVVAGTDGLFDNLAEYEIEQAMIKGTGDGLNPMCMASTLAELALYNSYDKYCWTPFSRASRKAGFEHHGGKIDDITVVVSYIVPSSAQVYYF